MECLLNDYYIVNNFVFKRTDETKKKKKEKLYLYVTLIHLFQIEIFIYISSSFLEDYRAKGKKIRVLSTKFRMNNLLISK